MSKDVWLLFRGFAREYSFREQEKFAMLLAESAPGRYHLLHQLGSGGTGTVYLAQDEQMSRQIALEALDIDIIKRSFGS